LNDRLNALYRLLGYSFRDPLLAQTALRHRSVGGQHNERLEYLGDAALGFIVARELYQRFPRATEGELSRLRAGLVKGQNLAAVAQNMRLGEHVILGPGELKSGGVRRESILAGALEALIGAVYLDGGIEPCETLVLQLLRAQLDACNPENVAKDPKTRLQEYLQGRRLPLPSYQTVAVNGADHAQTFTVTCAVSGLPDPVIGTGNSRRAAEQEAAVHALARLEGGETQAKGESRSG
jgi:ribonuclease-3